jgi:hypothetical protein
MNRLIFSLLLAAAVGACSSTPPPLGPAVADLAAAKALAATAPPEGEPLAPWLKAERERIKSEHEAADQRFDQAEKVCWRRFAVNDCVREARMQRRATLSRLRQEDLALNEVERQRLTATRMQELEQKQQDAADKNAAP